MKVDKRCKHDRREKLSKVNANVLKQVHLQGTGALELKKKKKRSMTMIIKKLISLGQDM